MVISTPTEVEEADVYKAGQRAARLARRGGAIVFDYDPDYLAAGAQPVAITLPLSNEPIVFTGGSIPPFFAGLLPEGARLHALVARVKTSADDMLSLLLAVGQDTVGDVAVLPVGTQPEVVAPVLEVGSWAETDFVELLAGSVSTAGKGVERVALPGVQDKVSAEVISFPVRGRGTSFILKFSPPAYPWLVENEAFFLSAARTAGLAAASAELVRDRCGRSGLLVTRFDRLVEPSGGPPQRLAQEDGCQILGRYPADKYRVDAAELVQAMAGCTTAPMVARRDLLRQLAYAHLVGNGDLHAKNLSIGQDPGLGGHAVTPAYDVLSTLPYGDPRQALALEGRRENLTRAVFLAFGERCGVRRRAVEEVLDAMCDSTDEWLVRVGEIGFDDRRTRDLARAIAYRRDELGKSASRSSR